MIMIMSVVIIHLHDHHCRDLHHVLIVLLDSGITTAGAAGAAIGTTVAMTETEIMTGGGMTGTGGGILAAARAAADTRYSTVSSTGTRHAIPYKECVCVCLSVCLSVCTRAHEREPQKRYHGDGSGFSKEILLSSCLF
jgi:hypothetical protein